MPSDTFPVILHNGTTGTYTVWTVKAAENTYGNIMMGKNYTGYKPSTSTPANTQTLENAKIYYNQLLTDMTK